MRCCDVEALWDELRDGVEPRREHVLAHLHGCPHCQEMYKENEGLAYCLSCLPIVEPPPNLVPKILEHIKTMRVGLQTPDAFGTLESPLGTLYIAFRETGITAIALEDGPEKARTRIEQRLRRTLRDAALPEWVREVIEGYFQTRSVAYDRLDISALTSFEQAALRQAALIPPGEVRSYGWIAEAIGHPQAARAVGRVMARNPIPFLYPCHRVVDAEGALHHYAYGLEMKRKLLGMEGYREGLGGGKRNLPVE